MPCGDQQGVRSRWPVAARTQTARPPGEGTTLRPARPNRAGLRPRLPRHGRARPRPGRDCLRAVEADLAQPSDENGRQAVRAALHALRRAVLSQPAAAGDDGSEHRRRHSVPIKRARDKWFQRRPASQAIQLGKDDYAIPRSTAGTWCGARTPTGTPPPPAPTERHRAGEAGERRHVPLHERRRCSIGDLNSGKDQWLGLENYILDSARTARLPRVRVHRAGEPGGRP